MLQPCEGNEELHERACSPLPRGLCAGDSRPRLMASRKTKTTAFDCGKSFLNGSLLRCKGSEESNGRATHSQVCSCSPSTAKNRQKQSLRRFGVAGCEPLPGTALLSRRQSALLAFGSQSIMVMTTFFKREACLPGRERDSS